VSSVDAASPSALASAQAIAAAVAEGGRRTGHVLALFDFDGTLAPLVPRYDQARLPPRRRGLLEALARRRDTTLGIVSGRQLADLKARVGIPGLYYAGLHGLQIEGPGVRFVHPDAEHARALVVEVRERLAVRIARLQGVDIEDKALSFSLHWRQAPEADAAAARRALDETVGVLAARGLLRLQPGERVCDVLPNVAWHKGEAVRWIRRHAERARGRAVWPVFAGDDLTDEHAIEVFAGSGVTIVVGGRPSAARFRVPDPDALEEVLDALAGLPPFDRAEAREP
jgi:trehalose 6-phosphate phosphatase